MLMPEGHQSEDICVKSTKDHNREYIRVIERVSESAFSFGRDMHRYTAMSLCIFSLSVLKSKARRNSFKTSFYHHEAAFALGNSSSTVCFIC